LTLVQFSSADARPIHPRLQDPGNLKTVMRVRDMDAAFERVRTKVSGVFTEGGAPIHPEGPAGFNRAVIMRDPDGFPLEFAYQNGAISGDVPSTSMIIGGWATFIVEDAATTLAFYRDVLGFQATGTPAPLADGVLRLQGLPMATGSMSVGVRPPGGAATWRMYDYRNVERTRLAGRLQDPGTVALSFWAENVSALLSRLKADSAGFARDPNGLLLQFVEAGR
jgi:catechol 2,3-dioxygenase-like lactoylglutathione lyase family enzyme